MLTVFPVRAAASSRSVCRHRKAGICNTSATCATGSACQLSCMSVRILSLYLFLTSSSISSPLSIPGPLKELTDVLFALSKDALKMMSVPSWLLISTMRAATSSRSEADSMTHGPAMNIGFIFFCLLSLLCLWTVS